jgi:hypothetical protein
MESADPQESLIVDDLSVPDSSSCVGTRLEVQDVLALNGAAVLGGSPGILISEDNRVKVRLIGRGIHVPRVELGEQANDNGPKSLEVELDLSPLSEDSIRLNFVASMNRKVIVTGTNWDCSKWHNRTLVRVTGQGGFKFGKICIVAAGSTRLQEAAGGALVLLATEDNAVNDAEIGKEIRKPTLGGIAALAGPSLAVLVLMIGACVVVARGMSPKQDSDDSSPRS